MLIRRVSVLAVGALILASWASAWGQEPTESQRAAAINTAGRLRLLSQKTIKEALQVALNVDADPAKEELKKSIDLFEKLVIGLQTGDPASNLPGPSEAAGTELKKIDPLWHAFRNELEQAVAGKPDAARLAQANEPLLKQTVAVTDVLAEETKKATGKEAGTVINIAGRQRMLSQRLAKSFFLIAAKYDVEGQRKGLEADIALFTISQKGLVDGDPGLGLPPARDAEVKTQLERVAKLWTDYRTVLSKGSAGGEIAADDLKKVAEMSVTLLTEADKAVGLFQLRSAGRE